jgi:hypothetical protein
MNKTQHEKEDHENLVAVYETGNEAIVSVVKSMLDEAKIRYIAQGEGVQDLFGVGIIGTGFNPVTGPVIFKVMPEDEEYARELLKDISE